MDRSEGRHPSLRQATYIKAMHLNRVWRPRQQQQACALEQRVVLLTWPFPLLLGFYSFSMNPSQDPTTAPFLLFECIVFIALHLKVLCHDIQYPLKICIHLLFHLQSPPQAQCRPFTIGILCSLQKLLSTGWGTWDVASLNLRYTVST